MKRTQRNLSIVITAIALAYLILIRLPAVVALGAASVLVAIGILLAILGRDFMRGRYRASRRQWQQALTHYRRFEKKLLKSRISPVFAPLYLSVYSFDGVAIVRNNIGQVLVNLRELDQAEDVLRSALQRDPLYPLPYLHLGVIAAMRHQEDLAQREMRKAVQLGYSPNSAQKLLRSALAAANAGAGEVK
jgi:tetratricopeptide (TPR) repeat protein